MVPAFFAKTVRCGRRRWRDSGRRTDRPGICPTAKPVCSVGGRNATAGGHAGGGGGGLSTGKLVAENLTAENRGLTPPARRERWFGEDPRQLMLWFRGSGGGRTGCRDGRGGIYSFRRPSSLRLAERSCKMASAPAGSLPNISVPCHRQVYLPPTS